MQPNTIPLIADLINTAKHPIVILLVAHGCENQITPVETEVQRILDEHEKPVFYYKWCVSEQSMVFPRTQAPIVYFFLPKNQQVAFWRDGPITQTLASDIDIAHKMLSGLPYEQARFTEDELKKIQEVDEFLEKEKTEMEQYPSTFQMARNLAKEMWNTGKRAARGLPVIVSAEVGFERLQICEGCDKFDAEPGRCTECGCFMRTKTQFASASCPLKKWEAVV